MFKGWSQEKRSAAQPISTMGSLPDKKSSYPRGPDTIGKAYKYLRKNYKSKFLRFFNDYLN